MSSSGTFQFQNGSINRIFEEVFGEPYTSFNSKMVRLIVIYDKKGNIKDTGFNSKMVRLIEFYYKVHKILIIVSIPKWFD